MKKIKLLISIIIVLLLTSCLGKNYNIEFITDDVVIDKYTIKQGEKLIKPNDPKKAGFVFVYWELDGEMYDFNQEVKESFSLIAKWEKVINKYTVTYNSDGGSVVSSETINEGDLLSIPTEPLKTGYIFMGWHLDNKEFDFETIITSNITLTAKWEKVINKYTVTYNSDGGSVISSETINEGDLLFIPEVPLKAGYTFVGWYLDNEEFDFETIITSDITLTAKWEKVINKYTVTYNSDGGSVVSSETINEGDLLSIPTEPLKTSYIFIGWYLDNEEFDFETIIASDITLTAKWKKVTASDLEINNIYLTGDIISINEIKGSRYVFNINGVEIPKNEPFYHVTSFPVSVKVKAIYDGVNGNYSEVVNFGGSKDIISNTINFNVNSNNQFNYLKLLDDFEYLYLLNEDYKVISSDKYQLSNENLIINEEFITEDKIIYLLTNKELIKVEINFYDDSIPRVINNLVSSSFLDDLILNIDGFGYEFGLSVIPNESYTYNNEVITIDKAYLLEEFSEGRNNLILGYSFTKGSTVYAGTLTIKYKESDFIKPVITLLENDFIKYDIGDKWVKEDVLSLINAWDNKDGYDLMFLIDDNNVFPALTNNVFEVVGEYVISIIVSDSNGNESLVEINIIVEEVVVKEKSLTNIDYSLISYYSSINNYNEDQDIIDALAYLMRDTIYFVKYEDARNIYPKYDNGSHAVLYDYLSRGNTYKKLPLSWGNGGNVVASNGEALRTDREHVWPKSNMMIKPINNSSSLTKYVGYELNNGSFTYGPKNTNRGHYSDLHNLWISVSVINATHSNHYYGEPSGPSEGYYLQNQIFYPGEEYVGDIARILFYMTLMYPHLTLIESNNQAIKNSVYFGYLDILLYWNEIDPPSYYEIEKNNLNFNGQGNRNPFIDFYDEGIADLIFEYGDPNVLDK